MCCVCGAVVASTMHLGNERLHVSRLLASPAGPLGWRGAACQPQPAVLRPTRAPDAWAVARCRVPLPIEVPGSVAGELQRTIQGSEQKQKPAGAPAAGRRPAVARRRGRLFSTQVRTQQQAAGRQQQGGGGGGGGGGGAGEGGRE